MSGINIIFRHYFQKGKWRTRWKTIELVALAVGFTGTATACLAEYGWHWFKESLFFVIWSAAPYGFLLLGNHIVRRSVKSPMLQPLTALLAVAMTILSLIAYIRAVLNPSHSSGMVFAILPLCWMIAVPVVLAGIVVGFLAASHPHTR